MHRPHKQDKSNSMPMKPVMLIILDGWGYRREKEGNAISLAHTPFLDFLQTQYPQTHLLCAGEAVGLPPGTMGNSEVGHLNIGAGRIVYQNLLRINSAIQEGSFQKNEILNSILSKIKANHSALHLMGLVSDGGVHSHLNHLFALLDAAMGYGLRNIYIHAILDGRDASPDSGVRYMQKLQNHIHRCGTGTIASICGRYFAMDRDGRWDRTEKAYRLFTRGEGRVAADPVEAIKNAYRRNESDEFVKPIAIRKNRSQRLSRVEDGDGIIFFNFRADRARQITRAFTQIDFDFFSRDSKPELCGYTCMTLYDEAFSLPVLFSPVHMEKILGEIISHKGLRQLRIAETEKYAHVTYFFNGGVEIPFPLEDRCLIPSPRDIPTYDLKPEMSAPMVTQEAIARLETNRYGLIVLNYANMDMVGHTGVLEAAIKACETVDTCLKKIVTEVINRGGVALITADHGNSEQMVANNGKIFTAHTRNPVPFILVDDSRQKVRLREGILADIAPTILEIMGITPPALMTGKSLLTVS